MAGRGRPRCNDRAWGEAWPPPAGQSLLGAGPRASGAARSLQPWRAASWTGARTWQSNLPRTPRWAHERRTRLACGVIRGGGGWTSGEARKTLTALLQPPKRPSRSAGCLETSPCRLPGGLRQVQQRYWKHCCKIHAQAGGPDAQRGMERCSASGVEWHLLAQPGSRTASGWERTLTTQNSFTNGLVLSFSSPGPQIALPELSAYSDLAGSRVPQEAGGRLLPRRRAGRRSPGYLGSRTPGVSEPPEEKDERCHFNQDLGSLRTAPERRC
ncbi:uncharacterized protein LOC129066093 [Pteronotus mesoamericanus]|uniref:uncharacterized protein LOC129066093 n=1 Tax=Pteronotus mesoamericanus TaxID=1884717 RepID=UPI0023EB0D3B|nr:uncharacterized protein LOC129066093 [Pteronotus parnellii mesoamericanus]